MAVNNLGFGGENPYLGKDNPYLTANIDSAMGDITRNYNNVAKPAMETAMANSGSFGNAGLGQMQGEQQRQLQQTLGNVANQMRGNDYNNQQQMYQWQQGMDTNNFWNNQNFDRSLYNDAYNQNMQNAQFGMGLLGTLNGVNQGDITNANTIQNTPLDYWSQFSNSANAAGNGFPTTTGTASSQTNPWIGALGGAQLANSAYTQWAGTPSGTTAAPGTGYDIFNNNPDMAIPSNAYNFSYPSF